MNKDGSRCDDWELVCQLGEELAYWEHTEGCKMLSGVPGAAWELLRCRERSNCPDRAGMEEVLELASMGNTGANGLERRRRIGAFVVARN